MHCQGEIISFELEKDSHYGKEITRVLFLYGNFGFVRVMEIFKLRRINPLSAKHILIKFPIFRLSASVDTMPLPGAWVAELLGVILGVQDR